MALGFGFNKAKVLAQAERFVQQGKLANAITEYEKIISYEPKDLTVLNTVGDLYVRVGENERAAQCFKKVGDQYAQDGFTVKAIAVYKKITRLSPGNFENIVKLGDLYSQQGLFNDARTQYMQVADQMLRSGDNSQAARIFQRILELDPENTITQTRLADLYMKLGKKAEARNIYYTAAEALYARGSYDAAGEALTRVMALDPENAKALMLRGMIAADGGDSASAAKYLGQVPDLETHPDGLHALLRAKLQSGNVEGAESAATKLLTAHKDMSGLRALVEWYVTNNQVGNALKLYDQHEDRFLAEDRAAFQALLHPLIGRIKNNPEALAIMQRLMQHASDNTQNAELLELQAHACAQKGELHQARDLYLKLSELEPDNAMHSQSYRQILARLGEDAATRELSPEEAGQAFMLEELDEATAVHQSYDPPTEQAIEAALTDAELYVSYNVPAKAIPPLEAVLPMAPRDISVNQRLAVLYARGERYADAARVCQVLSEVYHELGHEKDAARYQEAARRYSLRVPAESVPPAPPPVRPAIPHLTVPPPSPAPAMSVMLESPANVAPPAVAEASEESSVQEFTFDVPDHLLTVEAPPPPAPEETAPFAVETSEVAPAAVIEAEEHSPIQADHVQADHVQADGVQADQVQEDQEKETDLSGEWESMLSVEGEEAPPQPQVPAMPVAVPAELPPVARAADSTDPAAEKIEEVRFYLDQKMWDAAKKAILDLTEIAPDAPEVTELISAVSAGQSKAVAAAAPAPVHAVDQAEPPSAQGEEFAIEVEDNLVTANEPGSEFHVESKPPAPPMPVAPPAPQDHLSRTQEQPRPKTAEPAHEAILPAPAARAARQEDKVEAIPPAVPKVVVPPVPPPRLSKVEERPQEEPHAAARAARQEDRVESLPSAVPKIVVPPVPPPRLSKTDEKPKEEPPAKVAAAAVPEIASPPAPATRKQKAETPEKSPLEDVFAEPLRPPSPRTTLPRPPQPSPAPVREPAAEPVLDDILNIDPVVKPAKPAPPPAAVSARTKSTEDILSDFVLDMEQTELVDFAPRAKPEPVPPAPVTPAVPVHNASKNGDMQDAESASVLNDILAELQEENEGVAEPEDDAETHYNLGIAFKEMGLLDEAIGELQKVCHAVDRGSDFSQPIQAYTWLAQCLVDKGAPEAAVRWYQRALHLPRLDDGSRCAIYYDLAQAYEASGDKKSALANFMEVYGSNIDFRDVASRIKALKS